MRVEDTNYTKHFLYNFRACLWTFIRIAFDVFQIFAHIIHGILPIRHTRKLVITDENAGLIAGVFRAEGMCQWKSFNQEPPPKTSSEEFIFLFKYCDDYIPDIGYFLDGFLVTNGKSLNDFGDPIWWRELGPMPEKGEQYES